MTEGKANPSQLSGLPVEDIHNFKQKESCILVPHMGTYKEEIAGLLKSLGFLNVHLIAQLMTRTELEQNERVNVCENESNDRHSKIRKLLIL